MSFKDIIRVGNYYDVKYNLTKRAEEEESGRHSESDVPSTFEELSSLRFMIFKENPYMGS